MRTHTVDDICIYTYTHRYIYMHISTACLWIRVPWLGLGPGPEAEAWTEDKVNIMQLTIGKCQASVDPGLSRGRASAAKGLVWVCLHPDDFRFKSCI